MSYSWGMERASQDPGGCVRFGGKASDLCVERWSIQQGGLRVCDMGRMSLNRAEVLGSVSEWLGA